MAGLLGGWVASCLPERCLPSRVPACVAATLPAACLHSVTADRLVLFGTSRVGDCASVGKVAVFLDGWAVVVDLMVQVGGW